MIRLKLDYFLPEYDLAKKYRVIVHAPAERVFTAIKELDFSRSRVIRILFGLRGAYGFLFSSRKGEMGMTESARPPEVSLRTLVDGSGFIFLGEVANRELVLGLVGRFWKPSAGIVAGLDSARFVDFHQEGYCKAALNFYIEPNPDGTVTLSTETRTLCLGKKARFMFSLYWAVIGFFSGWIRLAMLGMAKTQAEERPIKAGEPLAK